MWVCSACGRPAEIEVIPVNGDTFYTRPAGCSNPECHAEPFKGQWKVNEERTPRRTPHGD